MVHDASLTQQKKNHLHAGVADQDFDGRIFYRLSGTRRTSAFHF